MQLSLYDLLYESKLKDLKRQYPDIANELDEYSDVLPKYLTWIAKQLRLGNLDNYLPNEIKQLLTSFEAAVSKNRIVQKDIIQYQNPFELTKAIENQSLSRTDKRNALAAELAMVEPETPPESHTIYEDDRYSIIQPLNKTAACELGRGTEWCISRAEGEGVNFFNKRAYRGATHFIITDSQSDNPLYSKVVVTIYPSGKLDITDSTNGGIPVMTFIGLYPDEVLEYFDEYLNGFSSAELETLGIT